MVFISEHREVHHKLDGLIDKMNFILETPFSFEGGKGVITTDGQKGHSKVWDKQNDSPSHDGDPSDMTQARGHSQTPWES